MSNFGTIYKKGTYYGGAMVIDNELSDTSENPVQNKVISSEINTLKSFGLSVVNGQLCQTYTI